MPRMDGTGPAGAGEFTGRGRGMCIAIVGDAKKDESAWTCRGARKAGVGCRGLRGGVGFRWSQR